MTEQSAFPVGHPAPHRDKVGIAAQLAGLAAGPVVWAVQLEFGYALTSYACHPGMLALDGFAPGWAWTRAASLAVNLVALLVCLGVGVLCWRAWQLTRHEASGPGRHAIEKGEGRTRFLAICGVLTSFGMALATAFDTVMLLGAPACRA